MPVSQVLRLDLPVNLPARERRSERVLHDVLGQRRRRELQPRNAQEVAALAFELFAEFGIHADFLLRAPYAHIREKSGARQRALRAFALMHPTVSYTAIRRPPIPLSSVRWSDVHRAREERERETK